LGLSSVGRNHNFSETSQAI